MIKRILKLVKKIPNLSAYELGKKHFEHPDFYTEALAERRMKKVVRCPHFKNEPIKNLMVKDDLIPEASGKYCDNCGCVISYKIRQSIEKCPCWDED